jgi:spore coat polysaccharide biosynthesis predicted glycosyltransferase SpsG
MNIIQKIKDANHELILLDYNIEPIINDYKTWIGKKYDEEINEFCNILQNNKYDNILIDHYGIDYILENEVKKYCKKIIVISDIFDYTHNCDIFINYNCNDIDKVQTINLNENTIYKIGVENIIINKKFIDGSKKESFNDKIKNITINMGGCDPQNYILQLLEITYDYIIRNNIKVNIIIGKSNNNIDLIKKFIKNNYYIKFHNDLSIKDTILHDYKIYFDINYDELIDLHINSDLVIGSLSITAYERLFLNIPQISVKIVENQLIQQLDEFNIVSLDNLMNKILEFPKKILIKNKINYPKLSIFD